MSKSQNSLMIERLKKEMGRIGFNARQLAVEAAVGQSFVYDVLSGKSCNPTTNKLAAVAEVLGVSVPYLVNGTTNDNEIQTTTNGNIIAITQIVPGSNGIISRDDVLFPQGKQHFFHKDWVKNNISSHYNDLRMVSIRGEQMHPSLKHGDLAILDMHKKQPTPPGVFALFDGAGLMFKRLEYIPTDGASVRVSVDSAPYSAYNCPLSALDVLGRIVWFSRLMDS